MRNLIKTALMAKSLRAGGPSTMAMYLGSRFLKGRTVALLTLGGMAARWMKKRRANKMAASRDYPIRDIP